MIVATTADALQLLHQGSLVFSQMEHSGIRIDVGYLDNMIVKVTKRVERMGKELEADEVYQTWKRHVPNPKLGSPEQLGKVVFDVMKLAKPELTEKSKEADAKKVRYRTTEEHLKQVNHPFVDKWLEWKFLQTKVLKTYLGGIKQETVDGFLHPVFNMHTTATYRSCIAEGSLVEIVRDCSVHPKGVPIERVRAGDYAYCYDDNLNLTVRKVLWAGKTGHRRVIRVHWLSGYGKKRGYIDLTPEHRVRLVNGSYVRAKDLIGRDFRERQESKRKAKVSVLAMGRDGGGDRIYPTGGEAVLDHRLVYETLVGDLEEYHVVHHKDGNHFNNHPSNLERMTKSEHAKHHAPECLDDGARIKGLKKRSENHRLFGDRWPKGEEVSNWVPLTKYQVLKALAEAKGKSARTYHCFAFVRKRAAQFGIDLKVVKDRYDGKGKYISLGRLKRACVHGRNYVKNEFQISFYKVKRILEQRGLSAKRLWANQYGAFAPGNHRIVKVEWTDKIVDVYDLEVEEFHNFIVNEICVHNSSDSINFQNIPIRDPRWGKIIRRCFIPRKGRHLVECDFKSVEVSVSACYNKDPVLIDYLKDKMKDMHRDMAAQCYMLEPGQVSKEIRYCGKNGFVFPAFYGQYFGQIAPAMWDMIGSKKLALPDGTGLYEHLKSKGIKKLGELTGSQDGRMTVKPGTFLHHIQKIEEDFWGRRFRVYAKWKQDWWDGYLKTGYITSLTGFRMEWGARDKRGGLLGRNDATNYPIQGSAFHCNLWVLIEMQKWLRKNKMETLLIGQIHDSDEADSPPNELQDYLGKMKELVSVDLPKAWDWIIVPMSVEASCSEVDGNWWEMKGLD